MCGILCIICYKHDNQPPSLNDNEQLVRLLMSRGPEKHNVIRRNNILFAGFVLWQQGHVATPQPVLTEALTLHLNGDIFNTGLDSLCSDTAWLMEKLSTCSNDNDVFNVLKTLKGPYSILLYNCKTNDLYFARDPLGRNSLLIEKDSTGIKILSTSIIENTVPMKTCVEIPPLGLFKFKPGKNDVAVLYPWKPPTDEKSLQNCLKEIDMNITVEIPTSKFVEPAWLFPKRSYSNYFDFYRLAKYISKNDSIYEKLLDDRTIRDSICKFLELLRHSVKERVCYTPKYCSVCIKNLKRECKHSKVAILFSGGIDCTILAIVANQFVNAEDSIDLLNVAFESPKEKSDIDWDVPDRCSAKESFEELKRLCPSRTWNFVEINVTRKEMNDELKSHIKHLIYPLNTVLDESLGCAFWFASRGIGSCDGKSYKSPARVVLIGSGADELFGGYTRHRNAYTRCQGSHEDKLKSLADELEMDWERLPMRNLGRDDRVISDNNKTSRAPFIEEDITHFVRSLLPEQRCCFLFEQGVGDKLFLRLSGFYLGLQNATKLKKRAIQFGSRIADKNQNAKDISVNIQ